MTSIITYAVDEAKLQECLLTVRLKGEYPWDLVTGFLDQTGFPADHRGLQPKDWHPPKDKNTHQMTFLQLAFDVLLAGAFHYEVIRAALHERYLAVVNQHVLALCRSTASVSTPSSTNQNTPTNTSNASPCPPSATTASSSPASPAPDQPSGGSTTPKYGTAARVKLNRYLLRWVVQDNATQSSAGTVPEDVVLANDVSLAVAFLLNEATNLPATSNVDHTAARQSEVTQNLFRLQLYLEVGEAFCHHQQFAEAWPHLLEARTCLLAACASSPLPRAGEKGSIIPSPLGAQVSEMCASLLSTQLKTDFLPRFSVARFEGLLQLCGDMLGLDRESPSKLSPLVQCSALLARILAGDAGEAGEAELTSLLLTHALASSSFIGSPPSLPSPLSVVAALLLLLPSRPHPGGPLELKSLGSKLKLGLHERLQRQLLVIDTVAAAVGDRCPLASLTALARLEERERDQDTPYRVQWSLDLLSSCCDTVLGLAAERDGKRAYGKDVQADRNSNGEGCAVDASTAGDAVRTGDPARAVLSARLVELRQTAERVLVPGHEPMTPLPSLSSPCSLSLSPSPSDPFLQFLHRNQQQLQLQLPTTPTGPSLPSPPIPSPPTLCPPPFRVPALIAPGVDMLIQRACGAEEAEEQDGTAGNNEEGEKRNGQREQGSELLERACALLGTAHLIEEQEGARRGDEVSGYAIIPLRVMLQRMSQDEVSVTPLPSHTMQTWLHCISPSASADPVAHHGIWMGAGARGARVWSLIRLLAGRNLWRGVERTALATMEGLPRGRARKNRSFQCLCVVLSTSRLMLAARRLGKLTPPPRQVSGGRGWGDQERGGANQTDDSRRSYPPDDTHASKRQKTDKHTLERAEAQVPDVFSFQDTPTYQETRERSERGARGKHRVRRGDSADDRDRHARAVQGVVQAVEALLDALLDLEMTSPQAKPVPWSLTCWAPVVGLLSSKEVAFVLAPLLAGLLVRQPREDAVRAQLFDALIPYSESKDLPPLSCLMDGRDQRSLTQQQQQQTKQPQDASSFPSKAFLRKASQRHAAGQLKALLSALSNALKGHVLLACSTMLIGSPARRAISIVFEACASVALSQGQHNRALKLMMNACLASSALLEARLPTTSTTQPAPSTSTTSLPTSTQPAASTPTTSLSTSPQPAPTTSLSTHDASSLPPSSHRSSFSLPGWAEGWRGLVVPPVLKRKKANAMIVKCLLAMGERTYAALISQFAPSPETYTQIFQVLKTNTRDHLCHLYCYFWDLAMLELLVHSHHEQRQETHKRAALKSLSRPSLNRNNPKAITATFLEALGRGLFLQLLVHQPIGQD